MLEGNGFLDIEFGFSMKFMKSIQKIFFAPCFLPEANSGKELEWGVFTKESP